MLTISLRAALAIQSTPTGQSATGAKLLESCARAQIGEASRRDTDDIVAATACVEYISGVSDLSQGLGLICSPDGITGGQRALVALKYLRDHPESLHEHRLLLVGKALKAVFPCKE